MMMDTAYGRAHLNDGTRPLSHGCIPGRSTTLVTLCVMASCMHTTHIRTPSLARIVMDEGSRAGHSCSRAHPSWSDILSTWIWCCNHIKQPTDHMHGYTCASISPSSWWRLTSQPAGLASAQGVDTANGCSHLNDKRTHHRVIVPMASPRPKSHSALWCGIRTSHDHTTRPKFGSYCSG